MEHKKWLLPLITGTHGPRANTLSRLFVVGLLALAVPAKAHIILDSDGSTPPRNTGGVSCGTAGDSPAVFAPGSRITVDYIVGVKHGDTIRIDFAEANDQGFNEHVLAEFASHFGAGQKTVTLPDIECDACTLRITETGYTSCADIRLVTQGPMLTDDTPPMPLTMASAEVMADAVTLRWQNPSTDFAETLWLMSYTPLTVTPDAGHLYVTGEMLDDAKVVYVGDGAEHQLTGLTASSDVYFAGFARDESGNYSPASTLSAVTGEPLPAPLALQVVVMQGDQLLTIDNGEVAITMGGGDVLVQAQSSRPDDSAVTWQVTDTALMNTAMAANNFRFDAGMLTAGDYRLWVEVQSGGEVVGQNVLFVVAPEADETNRNTPDQVSGGAAGWFWLMLAALLMAGRIAAGQGRRG